MNPSPSTPPSAVKGPKEWYKKSREGERVRRFEKMEREVERNGKKKGWKKRKRENDSVHCISNFLPTLS